MLHLLFILFYLVQSVYSQDTPSTPTCPLSESGVEYRAVWGILATCALTLLMCVWQAIHPDVPPQRWHHIFWKLSTLYIGLRSLLLPEWTVYIATKEWRAARRNLKEFHEKATEYGLDSKVKWTMTHSFFVQMDGFAYRTDYGKKTLHWSEYLDLFYQDRLANPHITEDEINDKSKTDALGKILLALQLIWFIVQVTVRYLHHFVVTLVELDTACMAIITIFLLFFWHNKPLRPEFPYIFYARQVQRDSKLLGTRDEEKAVKNEFAQRPPIPLRTRLNNFLAVDQGALVALCVTWIIFGALHLAAWNYNFATQFETGLWKFAAVVLTIAPFFIIVGKAFTSILKCVGCRLLSNFAERTLLILSLGIALLSRVVLIVLALVSLRSPPCGTYETVTWVAYVPHFQVPMFPNSV